MLFQASAMRHYILVPTLLKIVVNFVSTKNTESIRAKWCAPVIPATQEAETGELLEPRRQRLQ